MTEKQSDFKLMLRQTPDKDRKPGEIRRDELVSIELVQGLRRIEQKLDEVLKVLKKGS